ERDLDVVCALDGVALLAHKRMPAQLCLQPDLIALPRDEPDLDQRAVREPLEHRVAAHRLAATRIATRHRLLQPDAAVPREATAPGPRLRRWMPVDHGLIDAFGFTGLELALQRSGGRAGSRHDKQAGCVAVDAMDHLWLLFAAAPEMPLQIV